MKKLFTNDKFFLVVTMIGAIGMVAYSIIGLLSYPEWSVSIIIDFLIAFGILTNYITYKNHSKNVMKGMIGAVLMACLILRIISIKEIVYIPADKPCTILLLIFTAGLFLNHFAINSTRLASSRRILFNQLLCVMIAIIGIVWNIVWIVTVADAMTVLLCIISSFACPCVFASIVCVESRLDAYRLDREAAGWTEETGYPEDYVHEYEKKK